MKYYNWVNCFPRKQREKAERGKRWKVERGRRWTFGLFLIIFVGC
jgi:hypothetical protein